MVIEAGHTESPDATHGATPVHCLLQCKLTSRQVCKEQFKCLWMDICLYLSHPRAYCRASSCCSKRTQTPRYGATSGCLVETSEIALDIFSYIRHPYFCA